MASTLFICVHDGSLAHWVDSSQDSDQSLDLSVRSLTRYSDHTKEALHSATTFDDPQFSRGSSYFWRCMIFQSHYALKNRALGHDDAKLEGTGSVASMTGWHNAKETCTLLWKVWSTSAPWNIFIGSYRVCSLLLGAIHLKPDKNENTIAYRSLDIYFNDCLVTLYTRIR